jgi:hypothetical protein
LEAGKKKWIQARKDKILVKGIGDIQTYFLTQRKSINAPSVQTNNKKKATSTGTSDMASCCSDLSAGEGDMWEDDELDKTLSNVTTATVKYERLVDWQVESLGGLLKKIVAYRNQGRKKKAETFSLVFPKSETVLDEVQEIIGLPEFDNKRSTLSSDAVASIELSPAVKTQLRDLVEEIASCYHDNPFHNFEVRTLPVHSVFSFALPRPSHSSALSAACQSCDHVCPQASQSNCYARRYRLSPKERQKGRRATP